MRKLLFLFLFINLSIANNLFSQIVQIKGVVTSEDGEPIYKAEVTVETTKKDYYTDENGEFTIEIDSTRKNRIIVKAIHFEPEYLTLHKGVSSKKEWHVIMSPLNDAFSHELETVDIFSSRMNRGETGKISFDAKDIMLNPNPLGGVEGKINILVGTSNETSSQYSVRGGNFDENLVYINGFEVYRPFLVRSGQQEGLSIINSDLVALVDFSTGGFQAKYGDKLSSVLDITYKRPDKTRGSFMASLLGAQGHLEGQSNSGRWYYLIGVRQKSNQYLLQSQPTKGQYIPSFTDAQILVGYHISPKMNLEFLGNYARNRFTFVPESGTDVFGFINQAYQLRSLYKGQEHDQFDAAFGGISLNYKPTESTQWRFQVSHYRSTEFETYDLQQSYFLSAIETDLGKNPGDILYSLGDGSIYKHARNFLNADVTNVTLKGHTTLENHFIQYGLEFNAFRIYDNFKEWEYRDSAGFTQPHDSFQSPMYRNFQFENELAYTRYSAFIQDNITFGNEKRSVVNVGVRFTYTPLNKELLVSPRLQYSYRPDWKNDFVFRVSTGIYNQPPFYREMRAFDGELYTNLKSQKSWHVAGGFDYQFISWNERPFKFTAEVFYKSLWDITPYEYDNVRIRYYPDKSAVGYAYGGEVRLFGDIVKNSESWVSIGFLNTKNKFLNEDGTYTEYIPRPTDRRATVGLYFTDYLARNKNFKVFLNLMYATGLPYSMPGKGFEPGYQIRIPAYKRADIGFATLLLDSKRQDKPLYSLFSYFDDVWLSLEVFNLLGNLNTLGYQWIQPHDSPAAFLVPNRLTSRLINLKLAFRF